MFVDNASYLPEGDRDEGIVVHAYVVLGWIQVLEPVGIEAGVVDPGVDMAEELPDILVSALETKERTVAELDDVGMAEVRVGGEKRVFRVESEIGFITKRGGTSLQKMIKNERLLQ